MNNEQHITDIEKITIAGRMLAEAVTLPDIKQVISLAEAGVAYAKAANLGTEAQNVAAEIAVRGKRRAGEILAQLEKKPGNRTDTSGNVAGGSEYDEVLTESGTSGRDARRWQQIASLPEEEFEEYIEETKEQGEELTSSGIYKEVKRKERDAVRYEKHTMRLPDNKYSVIYADPPWQYGNAQHTREEQDTILETHYPTMPLDEICDLPIGDLSADDAVLFLWATSPLLPQAFQVIEAWGFDYKASFIWDKVKHNVGYYNSVRHEILLIATRGSYLPEKREGEPILFDSVQSIERTKHSEKPQKFREIIEYLYPSGKKIELFARVAPSGWDTWGNENV